VEEQPQDELSELRRRYRLLGEAHEARGRLLAKQRWEFAERLRDETEDRDREIEQLRSDIERLEAEIRGKQGEVERLENTKVLRFTAPLRKVWGSIKRR
jgi:predicted RNase H-like nuclease (RuvC/YqgF family)